MDNIYYSDDYPRDGCILTIDVQATHCSLSVFMPRMEKRIERYASVPHAEIGRMVGEWLAGKPPTLKAQSASGSSATE